MGVLGVMQTAIGRFSPTRSFDFALRAPLRMTEPKGALRRALGTKPKDVISVQGVYVTQ